MKNERRKTGISLIVLIITIVVVIILAAAVILSLSGNNPINNARVANLDQTKDGIESSILAYTGKTQSQTLGYYTVAELLTGNRSETESYGIVGDQSATNKDGEEIYNIDKTKFEEKIDTLPATPTSQGAWYVDGNGKVYLVYDKKESLPSWAKNKDGEIDDTFLNQFIVIKDGSSTSKGSAKEVADKPAEYYGATVTNYTANGVSDWKIFHSDGENIYLISSDYIPVDKIPATKGGNALVNTNSSYSKSAPLTPAVTDKSYIGSESIKNVDVRKWLSYISEYPQSTRNNIHAVAYLLDTDAWSVFKTDKADYAIGGPTLDMFAASYNKTHESKKIEYKVTENGYDVKWSTDEDFTNKWWIGGLSTSESLYVLPEHTTSGADAMWLASPSGASSERVMNVDCYGPIYFTNYGGRSLGFRPIVCLKSNVEIEQNVDGNFSLK